MKRLAIMLLLVALVGCNGDGGSTPDAVETWQDLFSLTGIIMNRDGHNQAWEISGTVNNLADRPFDRVTIHYRARTTGDVILDDDFDSIYDLPANASALFNLWVHDNGRIVTRWESWVEWREATS